MKVSADRCPGWSKPAGSSAPPGWRLCPLLIEITGLPAHCRFGQLSASNGHLLPCSSNSLAHQSRKCRIDFARIAGRKNLDLLSDGRSRSSAVSDSNLSERLPNPYKLRGQFGIGQRL
jgi:hypothetical protein